MMLKKHINYIRTSFLTVKLRIEGYSVGCYIITECYAITDSTALPRFKISL